MLYRITVIAARRDDVIVTSILLSHGAEVNKKDTTGILAVYYAYRNVITMADRTLIETTVTNKKIYFEAV